VVHALAALVPPLPSVRPPAAGNEELYKALNADQERANKGEGGDLDGIERNLHASPVACHGDGDAAAVQIGRASHGSRSLGAVAGIAQRHRWSGSAYVAFRMPGGNAIERSMRRIHRHCAHPTP
jgi:hypothetical protein